MIYRLQRYLIEKGRLALMLAFAPTLTLAEDADHPAMAAAFFQETLGLDAAQTDLDTAVNVMEAGGFVLDLILPSNDGRMALFSHADVGTAEGYSQVTSIATCAGTENKIAFQRFFHTGNLLGGIEDIVAATRSSGLVDIVARDDLPPGFTYERFDPNANTGEVSFVLRVAEGTLDDDTYLLNFEAIINYDCSRQD